MVEFYTGSEHIAHVRVLNPSAWDWEYEVNLIVGGVSISTDNIAVPAGASGTLDIPVAMPSTPGELQVSAVITEITTGLVVGTSNLGAIDVVAEPVPEVVVTLAWD